MDKLISIVDTDLSLTLSVTTLYKVMVPKIVTFSLLGNRTKGNYINTYEKEYVYCSLFHKKTHDLSSLCMYICPIFPFLILGGFPRFVKKLLTLRVS